MIEPLATRVRRIAARHASLLLLGLLCGFSAERLAAEPCPGIAAETAQRLFDRIKAIDPGSGYRFESFDTKESRITVLWSRDGKACPPIRIAVGNCASPFGLAEFRLEVPADLSALCPELERVVRELSAGISDEHPVGQHASLPASAELPFLAAVAAIVGAGLLVRRLGKPPGRAVIDWGDGAWIACILAMAVLFHRNILVAVTLELGAAWVVLGLLLCDRELLAIGNRRQGLWLAGVFVFAFLARWTLSSGGPGDLHLNLAAIWSNELDLRWGPAPIAGFRLLRLVAEVDDVAIVFCNIVLASALPVVTYSILAQLGIDRVAATAGAFVVAAHPLLITFSGVLGRQPAYLFAAFASVLALIGFLNAGGGRRLIAFAIATALATTSRPEGAQVMVVHLAVVMLVAAPRRRRAAAGAALAVLGLAAYAYVAHALSPKPLSGKVFGGAMPFLWTILLGGDYTPPAWIVAWVLGLLLGIRKRAAWIALVALLGLDAAWRWSDLYHMLVGQHRHVAAARYQTILLVPFAVGIALLAEALRALGPRLQAMLAAAFVAATALTFRQPYETLLRPFTADYEYRFLRKYALSLPAGSRLYVFDPPFDDMGFIDALLVGEFVRSPVAFGYWSTRRCEDLLGESGAAYLYVGSACAEVVDAPDHPLNRPTYVQWLNDCASMHARVRGDAVEEVDVPARKMSWNDFRDATARLGLYRLRDTSICEIGPRSSFHPRDTGRR